jgi:hypothetical protein
MGVRRIGGIRGEEWKTFQEITLERYMVGVHMKALMNKAVTYHNFKVRIVRYFLIVKFHTGSGD